MLRATVETVAEITGAEVLLGSPDTSVNGLAVDSREVEPGCIFAALPGATTDGHVFIEDALRAGARLVLVTRGAEEFADAVVLAAQRNASVLQVADSLAAVQALASWHRSRLRCAVIGVTGSTGKTTTKDFLAAVLGTSMRVVSTAGNRNNELGVPLTVFSAGSDTDALIVEMGMRGLGQIEELCAIARPHFGLVTNVGTSHIELLGSQEAVATAKGELVKCVPADGAVFLNGDDDFSGVLAAEAIAPVTYYGLGEKCTVHAENIELDAESKPSFDMVTPQGSVRVALPVPGRHNVYNALAAASVGLRLAVSLDMVAEGLAHAATQSMRMESITAASGVLVINDAYNANPSSMAAAVETLADGPDGGKARRRAWRHGRARLTDRARALPDRRAGGSLGDRRPSHGGQRARRIADGAKAKGMSPDAVRPCETPEEAIEVLDDLLAAGDAVLVKASRVMGLEAVVDGIVTPRAG